MGLDDLINKLLTIKNKYNLDNSTTVVIEDKEVLEVDFDTTANELELYLDN